MIGANTEFDAIVERCRLALRLNYVHGIEYKAMPLFDAELSLIRKRGFENSLVQFVECGDRLRQNGVRFHLIGSGGSSVIFFLLGMSEVDPIRHRTHFQRFWQTACGEPPIPQFVVLSRGHANWDQPSFPKCVSVHPMTALEAIPAQLEQRLTKVSITKSDGATLLSLHAGDTDGVFQLESDHVRWLLTQIRPTRIKGLAMLTALAQLSHSHPEVVAECLQYLQARSVWSRASDGKADSEVLGPPLLFQETIMSLLRRQTTLRWEETYRFVQEAAKDRMTEQHELWKPALEGLERHRGTNGEVQLQKLIAASRWAVCRAHHLANAITSYKAAYFRAHHREEFEQARRQMISAVEGV